MTKLFDESSWRSLQKVLMNDALKSVLSSGNTFKDIIAPGNAFKDYIASIAVPSDTLKGIIAPSNALKDYVTRTNATSDVFKSIISSSDTFKSVFDTSDALKSMFSSSDTFKNAFSLSDAFKDYVNVGNATLHYLQQLQTDLEHEPDQREILEYPETELRLPETRERIVIYSPSIILLEKLRAQHLSLHDLTWRQFEEVVAELLTQDGYTVDLGRGTKDDGVDIIAAKDIRGIGLMISVWQAKKLAIGNKVGVSVIRELADTRDRFKANKGVIVTTTSLTKGALERIEQDRYLLYKRDGDDLNAWIREGHQL